MIAPFTFPYNCDHPPTMNLIPSSYPLLTQLLSNVDSTLSTPNPKLPILTPLFSILPSDTQFQNANLSKKTLPPAEVKVSINPKKFSCCAVF